MTPSSPPPRFPFLANLIEFFLLSRGKVFLHIGNCLIEDRLCCPPVLSVQRVELICNTRGNAPDFFPLLGREIELSGEPSHEQISDDGAVPRQDPRDSVADIHPGAETADEHSRKE
jgi:hypothetical protein